ncbi:MAG: hypothetical protein Q4E03_06475 [Trueperella sp.]|nr:hypothetical protein [Trueperella sp.]
MSNLTLLVCPGAVLVTFSWVRLNFSFDPAITGELPEEPVPSAAGAPVEPDGRARYRPQ